MKLTWVIQICKNIFTIKCSINSINFLFAELVWRIWISIVCAVAERIFFSWQAYVFFFLFTIQHFVICMKFMDNMQEYLQKSGYIHSYCMKLLQVIFLTCITHWRQILNKSKCSGQIIICIYYDLPNVHVGISL